MADENKFLFLGSNKDKILYDKLNGKLEKKDVANNRLLQIFDFFDKDKNGIIENTNSDGVKVNEMQSLWNAIKTSATKNNNSIFEESEAQDLLLNTIGASDGQLSSNDLFDFLKTVVAKTVPKRNSGPELKEQQCKEVACQILDINLREAFEIFNTQHLGNITGAYDNAKDDDDKLKTSNVAKIIGYQKSGFAQIIEAKNGNLTRRQYYEENKQRIKDMILTRLNVLKTDYGNSFIDSFRGKYSKDEITEMVKSYVENLCSNASLEKLKEIQKQFVSYNQVEETEALSNLVKSAKSFHENLQVLELNSPAAEGKSQSLRGSNFGIIPTYWDSDKPISFEEVYKLERGTEYSQKAVEKYLQAQTVMSIVTNAYNKKQQFVMFMDTLREKELMPAQKEEKFLEGLASFYALSDDGGLIQLQEIIEKSKLPITIKDGKLDWSNFPEDEARTEVLNQLLKIAAQEKEEDFKSFLGDKTIEDYQLTFEKAANKILGEENSKLLAEAMVNDNMGMIKRYTGNASMIGMGLVAAGGLLFFTPIGGAVITLGALKLGTVSGLALGVGNTLALTGMAAKTGFGVTDYVTKDVQTKEELEGLTKDFILDAGGLIVGIKAGQWGMKAFNKLIDQKLVEVFGKQIASGDKLQALKTVFTNPEYLKSFTKASGAKISTDLLISYLGDLVMTKSLGINDDWESLLQANLIGVIVGMSSDARDVWNFGRVYHAKEFDTPETMQQYIKNHESGKGIDLNRFDYTNGVAHIKNITELAELPSHGLSKIINNEYFYSEEGIKAIEIASKYFDLYPPKDTRSMSPLCSALSVYTPKEILVLEKRGLLKKNASSGSHRLRKLANMSDEEYASFVLKNQKSISSTGKSYEELKNDLFNKLETEDNLTDKYYIDNAKVYLGHEESIVPQIEMLEYLKNTKLLLKDFELINFLGRINIDNNESVKNILKELEANPKITTFQLNSIIDLTNPNTEKILLELLAIKDVPISKIIKYCRDTDDFINGKVTKEMILEKINNDSFVKTIRAINSSTLLKTQNNTTPLNPDNIQTSSLALVHMTKYDPKGGMILSQRDKLGGSRNSVHFTLNHAVTAHGRGDWDSFVHAIIMPYESTVKANGNGKFIEGMPNDLYTNGSVKIPEGAVIVNQNLKLSEGTIKISEHPTIKGVTLIETASLPHDIVPVVLEKIGYSNIQGDAPLGLFNHGETNGRSVDDVMNNYDAWNNFCKTQGIKPTRHSATPGSEAERIIENIGKLSLYGSWEVGKGFNKTNHKPQLLKVIDFCKKWKTKGYFVSYDLDIMEKIIKESATPKEALKRMKKELNLGPTEKSDLFSENMLNNPLDLFEEWLVAVENPVSLKEYVIENVL